jgi:3-oxoacyl-[acyl-carrier protein] reductase
MKSNEFYKSPVIITGGGNGSGLQIVKNFLELGAHVYSLDIKFKKKNIQKSKKLEQIKIDLSKSKEIIKFSNYIFKKEKNIKCIVNNAGITLEQNSNTLDVEKYWDETFDINVKAPFLIVNHLKKKLNKNSTIVNITSISGQIAMKNNPAYNSSKAALSALTRSLAFDLSEIGVRVNSVSPGYIKTNMTKKSYLSKKKRKSRTDRMMIKNFGDSKDIANAVIFLASSQSSYINGEELVVDGGLLKKGI